METIETRTNQRMNYLIHCLYTGQAIIIELYARLRLQKAFHVSTIRVFGLLSYRCRRSRLNAVLIRYICRLCVVQSVGYSSGHGNRIPITHARNIFAIQRVSRRELPKECLIFYHELEANGVSLDPLCSY